MYVPNHFLEDRPHMLIDAVRSIKLAAVVTAAPSGLLITHLPMFLKVDEFGAWTLEAHVARGNDHWRFAQSSPTAAIFQGPQAYISPSWYETKQETGKVVPTWNYIAVHAHGCLHAIDDEAWLLGHLHDLTDHNESGRPTPWSVDDAPADYIGKMIKGIVGLQLKVERLEGSWKMAQQKVEGDRLGVIAGLEKESAGHTVIDVMKSLELTRSIKPENS